jgi:hypothetical protein
MDDATPPAKVIWETIDDTIDHKIAEHLKAYHPDLRAVAQARLDHIEQQRHSPPDIHVFLDGKDIATRVGGYLDVNLNGQTKRVPFYDDSAPPKAAQLATQILPAPHIVAAQLTAHLRALNARESCPVCDRDTWDIKAVSFPPASLALARRCRCCCYLQLFDLAAIERLVTLEAERLFPPDKT